MVAAKPEVLEFTQILVKRILGKLMYFRFDLECEMRARNIGSELARSASVENI